MLLSHHQKAGQNHEIEIAKIWFEIVIIQIFWSESNKSTFGLPGNWEGIERCGFALPVFLLHFLHFLFLRVLYNPVRTVVGENLCHSHRKGRDGSPSFFITHVMQCTGNRARKTYDGNTRYIRELPIQVLLRVLSEPISSCLIWNSVLTRAMNVKQEPSRLSQLM
jgi:hypothetical protein